ncbi:uncharacterized protein LOC125748415 isoform X6 [Brienomyrus brachyistius]|uniref:uncharacterized protein LOC125748415 isoform X6 n=2 Tax=Brienomyrus brachyistius TaxID=42636 RepID=UPI0020B373A4|nr:uncharacterized protein LOC125748415 isoform X6 [Brienomyrus brachyistius]
MMNGCSATAMQRGIIAKTEEGLQAPGPDSKETEIPTQSYKTMWNHLNSKLRRHPVIGLRAIVEYHEDNQAPYMMCESCATRIPQGFIVGHLIGAEHRYKYIKSLHPKLINGWKDDPDFSEYQDALEEKAKYLEVTEGLGDIQIMKKGKAGFELVVLPSSDKYQMHGWAGPETSVKNLPIKKEHEAVIVKGEHVEHHVIHQLSASHTGSADSLLAEGTWSKSGRGRPSLRSAFASKYLSGKQTKRIVGLRAVVECQAAKVPPFYVCNVCRARFSFSEVFSHVQSSSHCCSYIRSQYPHLMEKFGVGVKPIKPVLLRSIAKELCRTESMGDTLVIKLDLPTYQKLQKISTRKAMNILQFILKNQDYRHDAGNPKKTADTLQGQMKVEERALPEATQRVPGQRTCPPAGAWAENVQTKDPHMPVVEKTLPGPAEDVKMASDSEREAFGPGGWAMLAQHLGKFDMKKFITREEVISKRFILPSPVVDLQFLRIKKTGAPMDESHLAKFMLPFLSGKAHPVVGLGKIVECRSFKEPTFYLCLSCSLKLEKANICGHIVHWHHQYCYMRLEHPHLLKGCEEGSGVVNTTYLVKLAYTLMGTEGMGHTQVKKLDRNLYQKVALASFETVLEKLKIQRELQPQMTSRPSLVEPQISVQWQQSSKVPIPDPGGPNKPPELSEAGGVQQKALLGKQRLQEGLSSLKEDPGVLGLHFVLECRCVDDDSCPYYYLCQTCSLRLQEDQIVEHLHSSLHQFYYITSHRPWLLEAVRRTSNQFLLGISELLKLATMKLRETEGSGDVQVMLLHKATYSKLVMESYESWMTVIMGTAKQTDSSQEKACSHQGVCVCVLYAYIT